MLTEIIIKLNVDIPDQDSVRHKVIHELVREAAGTLSAQVTMVSSHKVKTEVTMENNDIGTVKVDLTEGT